MYPSRARCSGNSATALRLGKVLSSGDIVVGDRCRWMPFLRWKGKKGGGESGDFPFAICASCGAGGCADSRFLSSAAMIL